MPITLRQQLPALLQRGAIAMPNHTTILENPRKVQDLTHELAVPGVYVIHNTESDCFYIGQSHVVITRLLDHFESLENGDHGNKALQREYKKFGKNTFVVDLLHNMTGCERLERLRMETKEIQRYKRYHRRLYNVTLNTIKTSPTPRPSIRESFPVKNEQQENKIESMTDYFQRQLQNSLAGKEPELTDDGICVECGGMGRILIEVFRCEDKKVRCGPCIDKLLDGWNIDFSRTKQKKLDRQAARACFRWQLDNRNYLNQELASALSRFSEKHQQDPTVLFVNLAYIGPSEMKGVKIRKRKVTPKGCADIPIYPELTGISQLGTL